MIGKHGIVIAMIFLTFGASSVGQEATRQQFEEAKAAAIQEVGAFLAERRAADPQHDMKEAVLAERMPEIIRGRWPSEWPALIRAAYAEIRLPPAPDYYPEILRLRARANGQSKAREFFALLDRMAADAAARRITYAQAFAAQLDAAEVIYPDDALLLSVLRYQLSVAQQRESGALTLEEVNAKIQAAWRGYNEAVAAEEARRQAEIRRVLDAQDAADSAAAMSEAFGRLSESYYRRYSSPPVTCTTTALGASLQTHCR